MLNEPARNSTRRHTLRILLRALPLLAAVLLYSYALRLPFFLDDGLHFAMIQDYPANGVPGLRFWGGAISFPYYRPAVFTLWEVNHLLVGGHFDPLALHMVNVLGFGLAGAAWGALARRLCRRESAGVITGLAFVLFPFSYAAVILVAALFHVALVLGAALTLLFALRWMDGGGRHSLLLCWFSAFAAVFSHENGVLILPLLALLLALVYGARLRRARLRRRALLVLLPIAAMFSLYLYLWLTVPRANDPPRLLETAFVSLGLMLQGLAYPFAALTRTLTCAAGTCAPGDAALLWGLALALTAGALCLLRGRARLFALFGATWYALGALPSALLLTPDYISGSPRLLMFSALGAALLYGVGLAFLLNNARGRFSVMAARVLAAGLIALMAVYSLSFLSARRDEALAQARYTWALLDLLQTQNARAPLLVNAPAFLAPREQQRTFLAGAEGVVFMAEYVYFDQQFWAMTGHAFPRIQALADGGSLRYAGTRVYAPYQTVGEGGFAQRLHAASHIYATYFDGGAFWPVYVGSPGAAGSAAPLVWFGANEIALTAGAYTIADAVVTVMTRWRVDVPGALKPFAHVLCEGALVAQRDGAPWGETYPFSQWQPGEIQTDVRQIPLPADIAPDCVRVVIGVYRESDGLRLPAIHASSGAGSGARYADDLFPIEN
ncbi:MAG: hypothetical protein HXY40_09280 [Chloroflexi bacterium]|nr:hypothetical protein [Chloroflexota bacterium]